MLRFMCVGDSMTIGSAGEHTWRRHMWEHLTASLGEPFQLVGPRQALWDPATASATSDAYADPDFPVSHRGHLAGWGEGWLHMAPLVKEAVTRSRADVLLVSLGLIDLGFYAGAEETALNVHRFVTAAREANPSVRIAVMPVVPNVRAESDTAFAEEVAYFNVLLGKAVAELSVSGPALLLVSPPADWSLIEDTYDGTHPNTVGEHKYAAAFASALHQAWGMGAPYAAGEVAARA